MRTTLPEPLTLPWELKPVSSAQSGIETLADGRRKFWIKEDLVGITPTMLVWWFSHLEGDVEIEGRLLNRYRVWHPFDHVGVRYVHRAPDGSIGLGAQIAASEFLGRNPHYKVEGLATIEKLDLEGFINTVTVHGLPFARLEHTFQQTPGGTHFEHALIVPGSQRIFLLSKLIIVRLFSDSEGKAWLKHAIEEMGALEHFLPDLYEREVRGETRPNDL